MTVSSKEVAVGILTLVRLRYVVKYVDSMFSKMVFCSVSWLRIMLSGYLLLRDCQEKNYLIMGRQNGIVVKSVRP